MLPSSLLLSVLHPLKLTPPYIPLGLKLFHLPIHVFQELSGLITFTLNLKKVHTFTFI